MLLLNSVIDDLMLHMKYARNNMLFLFLSLMLQRFSSPKPFSDDEVEHIREVFCEYLYKQVLQKLDN